MNQNNNQGFNIEEIDIKTSYVEIVFNGEKKYYEILIDATTEDDKGYLKINHYGSGLYDVNPKRAFAIIDGINKRLSLIRIKDKNDK